MNARGTYQSVCYIAGPMTGYPGFNYRAFDHAKEKLEAIGWEVISPADLDRENLGIDFSTMEGTEDLSGYVEAFARQDLDALLRVHAVFVLDGWENSTGARNEMSIAAMLGVPCFSFSTRELIAVESRFAGSGVPESSVGEVVPEIDEEQRLRVVPDYVPGGGEVRVVDPATGGEKGTKLARFDLIPSGALWQIAEHFGRGATKYEARNWERGYAWSLSYGALLRHLHAWWSGEDNDPELGSPHLAAVGFHVLALLTFAETHPDGDDRP